jgi:hypothetical protein
MQGNEIAPVLLLTQLVGGFCKKLVKALVVVLFVASVYPNWTLRGTKSSACLVMVRYWLLVESIILLCTVKVTPTCGTNVNPPAVGSGEGYWKQAVPPGLGITLSTRMLDALLAPAERSVLDLVKVPGPGGWLLQSYST